jgi:hypothetical protein
LCFSGQSSQALKTPRQLEKREDLYEERTL